MLREEIKIRKIESREKQKQKLKLWYASIQHRDSNRIQFPMQSKSMPAYNINLL